MCNRVAIIREGSIIKIEDIKTLQKDNYKKIHITGTNLDQNGFNVEGVTNLTKEDDTVHFFYNGDINIITNLLSQHTLSDVTIEEPTLEEIFMHYYE